MRYNYLFAGPDDIMLTTLSDSIQSIGTRSSIIIQADRMIPIRQDDPMKVVPNSALSYHNGECIQFYGSCDPNPLWLLDNDDRRENENLANYHKYVEQMVASSAYHASLERAIDLLMREAAPDANSPFRFQCRIRRIVIDIFHFGVLQDLRYVDGVLQQDSVQPYPEGR